jgi:hypothetical protein
MSAISANRAKRSHAPRCRQDGVAAVEFALVAVAFFLIVCGIIELARAVYMINTLAEVTRSAAREAANIDFRQAAAIDGARKRALFDDANGRLPFGEPVTYQNVRVEYMYLGPKGGGQELQLIPTGSMPSCPAKNRVNCMADPNSPSCIRAVQVRICKETSGTCTPIPYQSLISVIQMPLTLPTSVTIVTAETLGYKTGDPPCS